MRVLCLDFDLGCNEDSYSFGSTVSLYDYDLVVWNPARTLIDYLTYASTYRGKKSLCADESAKIVNDTKRRRLEFQELVELGRTLVVVLPGDVEVYVDNGEREYSGTGRNRATTIMVNKFDLMSAVPVDLTRFYGAGLEMEASGATMASLYKATRDYWTFRCTLEDSPIIKPLLTIKGTNKMVAGMITARGDGGQIVLLPDLHLPFDDDADDEADHGVAELDADAGEDPSSQVSPDSGIVDSPDDGGETDPNAWPGDLVIQWIETLISQPDASLPSWTGEYLFHTEPTRATELAAVENELASVEERLEKLHADQAQDERWKLLITATGTSLERRVQDAFILLGFDIEEGHPGRTDLRGERDGDRVVVEVKGVTKTAAERNAAQLEKWVSEELSQGRSAKGILVVNTWRELPLKERNAEDFPHQMLAYSAQRGHCLITGLQLLAMVRACLADSNRTDEIAQLLMDTTGPVAGWDELSKIFGETGPVAESSTPAEATVVEPIAAEDIPAVAGDHGPDTEEGSS